MNGRDWEDLLASEPARSPRPEFEARVMAAVREAALEPAPLPVPWRRALAGAAALIVFAGGGAAWVWAQRLPEPWLETPAPGPAVRLAWGAVAALACAVTLAASLTFLVREDRDVDGLSL